MYDATRTARRVTGRRRPTVGAVLVAVLLALFATSGGGGAETVRVERAGGGAAAPLGLHLHPAMPGPRPGTESAARPPGPDATGPSTGPDATGQIGRAHV